MKKTVAFLFLLVSALARGQATYNPSYTPLFTIASKPYAISQGAPVDGRTYKADSINFLWRPYNGTTEVLSYLNLSKYRTGQFPIVVNVGGTLNSNGTFTGGTIDLYWFRQGTADGDLVRWYTDSTVLSGVLLAANNLSDVQSVTTSRANLGLDTMALLGSVSHGDISGFWPWIIVNSIQGHNLAYIQNYNNLSNLPTIPAQFNPIAGANIALAGTYPNITFSATTGAGTFIRGSGTNINYLYPIYTPPTANPTSGGNDSVGIGTPTPQGLFQVAGGKAYFDSILSRVLATADTTAIMKVDINGNLYNGHIYPSTIGINSSPDEIIINTGSLGGDTTLQYGRFSGNKLLQIGSPTLTNPFVQIRPLQFNINNPINNTSTTVTSNKVSFFNNGNQNQGIIASQSQSIPAGLQFTMPVAPHSDTLEYMADTSVSNPRAKVTQAQFSKSITNADNGVSDSSGTVQLGGSLNQATNIGLGIYNLMIGFDTNTPGTSFLDINNTPGLTQLGSVIDPTDFLGFGWFTTQIYNGDSIMTTMENDSSNLYFAQHRLELQYTNGGGLFGDVWNVTWAPGHIGTFTFDPLSNDDTAAFMAAASDGTFYNRDIFATDIKGAVGNFVAGQNLIVTNSGGTVTYSNRYLDTSEVLSSNAVNGTITSSPIFSFPMISGHTYAVDCFLVVGSSAATGGAAFNVLAQSGSATTQVTTFGETSTSSTFTNVQTADGVSTTGLFITLIGTGMVHIQGTVACTGTGTESVGFASGNGSNNVTINASGSYCKFTQIN